MQNVLLFVVTVLVWGSTWYAVAVQVPHAPLIVSALYRFVLAAVVMVSGLLIIGRLKRPLVWRYVILQALCLFSLNYLAFYRATALIPSGFVAVMFSLSAILNAVNARIFFGERITFRVVLAGGIGLAGLVLIFWQDLIATLNADTLRGVAWAGLGTMLFSLGNMASRMNGARGVTPVTANAWGMCFGALVLLTLTLSSRTPIVVPDVPAYWTAMLYLSVIGSVVAFTTYLIMVARIGSARAAYATVFFPVVALAISTVFEGYVWTGTALAGVLLTLVGNLVMFLPRGLFRRRT
ncbi:DMT family transporter [Palleronia caenipelagi]|uniref:EamA family transporter n=1 Tax=Palleronia caenipelagi TaxID=2489174 RepID=A0A547Q2M8_9RHOB|nr:DMT family transporter [Palleronia caenipelagi]TRD20619.1 EamA family transporter [Palleronia caenipelagi]